MFTVLVILAVIIFWGMWFTPDFKDEDYPDSIQKALHIGKYKRKKDNS